MIKIEIGGQAPFGPAPKSESVKAVLNESLFDVVYYIHTKAIEKAKEIWLKSKLRYGYFSNEAAVFVLFDFIDKDWKFDVSINIKKLKHEDSLTWLNNYSNVIRLFLVDCRTNKVLAMRAIGVEEAFTKGVKTKLINQLYYTADQVDRFIDKAEGQFTTGDMLSKAVLYKLD